MQHTLYKLSTTWIQPHAKWVWLSDPHASTMNIMESVWALHGNRKKWQLWTAKFIWGKIKTPVSLDSRERLSSGVIQKYMSCTDVNMRIFQDATSSKLQPTITVLQNTGYYLDLSMLICSFVTLIPDSGLSPTVQICVAALKFMCMPTSTSNYRVSLCILAKRLQRFVVRGEVRSPNHFSKSITQRKQSPASSSSMALLISENGSLCVM